MFCAEPKNKIRYVNEMKLKKNYTKNYKIKL